MLYEAHKWVSRILDKSCKCQFATNKTSIFQDYSKNTTLYDVDASGFKQCIIKCFKELKVDKNDTSGFKLDIIVSSREDVNENCCVDKYFFLLGDGIPCVFVTSDQERGGSSSRPLLVYYGGNAETIFDFCINCNTYDGSPFWNKIVQHYDILCPSLPGYFLNHMGDFSEKTRKSQIDYVSVWCSKYYRDNVYILGYSLGCHFAILLADVMKTNCKHLLLTNPFLTDKTAARWAVGNQIGCCGCLVSPLYKSKLDNGEKIKQVKCPIDFFYSLHDKIVNPQDAHTLYDIAKNNGNNQVSLLPHGQRRKEVVDKPYSREESRFWCAIDDYTCCYPIDTLSNIIDVSCESRYKFTHNDFSYSDVLSSRFYVH